ncbi:hypothetical protein GCM10022268_00650 [Sphingomonas cynarae]|uniref:Uncharacterized protein n=1 Tax=Sphingomonas cynarae TaxID=930197 RepID=A0ABP7CST7_9SPHN
MPIILQLVQEAAWFATSDERLLGVVVWDRTDHDFGWVVLGRDRRLRYRAVAQDASLPTFEDAREALAGALDRLYDQQDDEYHQGDEEGPPVDFFAPIPSVARRCATACRFAAGVTTFLTAGLSTPRCRASCPRAAA